MLNIGRLKLSFASRTTWPIFIFRPFVRAPFCLSIEKKDADDVEMAEVAEMAAAAFETYEAYLLLESSVGRDGKDVKQPVI